MKYFHTIIFNFNIGFFHVWKSCFISQFHFLFSLAFTIIIFGFSICNFCLIADYISQFVNQWYQIAPYSRCMHSFQPIVKWWFSCVLYIFKSNIWISIFTYNAVLSLLTFVVLALVSCYFWLWCFYFSMFPDQVKKGTGGTKQKLKNKFAKSFLFLFIYFFRYLTVSKQIHKYISFLSIHLFR